MPTWANSPILAKGHVPAATTGANTLIVAVWLIWPLEAKHRLPTGVSALFAKRPAICQAGLR